MTPRGGLAGAAPPGWPRWTTPWQTLQRATLCANEAGTLYSAPQSEHLPIRYSIFRSFWRRLAVADRRGVRWVGGGGAAGGPGRVPAVVTARLALVVALQPLLDPLPFPRGQETVDIGVQVVFGDGVEIFRHFGLRMLITLSSFMASANWRRARESRDMTVPIGMAIISATSW